MVWARYRRLLSNPTLRSVLLLGLVIRVPMFAVNVVLTLHVVSRLGLSYGAAGLVSGAATIAVAISNPWRGRLLDRVGLRRVLVPSIAVGTVCGSILPFVGYEWLVGMVALSGLFTIPSFTLIRQAVMAVSVDEDRRAALSLDSVMVESAFMLGPALGVWAASVWRTDWVLFTIEMAGIAGGVALWVFNPALRRAEPSGVEAEVARDEGKRALLAPPFIALCALVAAAAMLFIATDIGVVAAMRSFGQEKSIGWVLSAWGAGSLIGGLVYGGLHRSFSPATLLLWASAVTLPVAMANSISTLTALVFVAGLLCAPTITASLDILSDLVPERFRGEAMGWHGSSMTLGSALGGPIAGVVIDRWGWPTSFAAVSMLGLAVALVGASMFRPEKGQPGGVKPAA